MQRSTEAQSIPAGRDRMLPHPPKLTAIHRKKVQGGAAGRSSGCDGSEVGDVYGDFMGLMRPAGRGLDAVERVV
jgi:hypothetical protein